MFESIKEALNKKSSGGGQSDILKTEIGNTYEVKVLPNVKNPKKTFFEYYMHGWESFATGQYVQILSPTTFNERDPISEERFKILKLGSEAEKAKVNKVRRAQKWLVNVLVIKDPVNPENEGKVKILRYGKQLQTIIDEAIKGADAEEFGEAVFDMNAGGAILKIKVDKQQEFPSYTSSRFVINNKWSLDPQEQKRVCDSIHDLESLYDRKSFDEVLTFFNTHYHVDVKTAEKAADNANNSKSAAKSDDDLIAELSGSGSTTFDSTDKDVSNDGFDSAGDAEIDDILKDL
jgi:hypothetical protein